MFKNLFTKWLFEIVGAILVIALAYGIVFATGWLTKTEYLGIAVLAIIYFYCSPMINPYINELRDKITKNIGKKSKKSDKK